MCGTAVQGGGQKVFLKLEAGWVLLQSFAVQESQDGVVFSPQVSGCDRGTPTTSMGGTPTCDCRVGVLLF